MNAYIVTIYHGTNYGNKLQHYAVKSVLLRFGLHTISLTTEQQKQIKSIRLKYFLQKSFRYCLPGDELYWKRVAPRTINFLKFDKKYFKTDRINKLPKLSDKDIVVIGSDQVWNPTWYGDHPLLKDLYLLTFVRPYQKVCFAPSFGIEKLPEEWTPWFREQLCTFPRISVREESGRKIVKELTGEDAEVLIDPTLMLDAKEWIGIAKQPEEVDFTKPYVLTYFLGRRTDEADSLIDKIKKDHGFEVYSLMEYDNLGIYASGPCEFIYLIAHASLILTDSFHGSVFSFLFGKPFLVYERKGEYDNMFSRIDGLLDKFDLRRKYAGSGLENDLFECDYSLGKRRLQGEREKVILFLKESLEVN